MKYCEVCGAELEDNMRFCPQCGQPAGADGQQPEDLWARRLAPENLQKPEAPDPDPQDTKNREPDPVSIYFPEKPEKPRRGNAGVRRLWVVISILCGFVVLMVCLLIALCAMRREPAGKDLYYGRTCVVGDKEYSGEGDWVSLSADGKAELFLMNTGGRGTWEMVGPEIIIDCGDLQYRGTLSNGTLELQQGKVRFLLSREGLPVPKQQETEPGADPSIWEGDYYGWWQVTEGWGGWKSLAGSRWDACGRIWLETEREGKLELWDSDCRMGELFCAADIRIAPGSTDAGCLETVRGRFCDLELEAGQWRMDPGREPYRSMPGLICLEGSFIQDDSGFSYAVFLRPWGMEWEDVEDMPSDPLPEKKRLPLRYKDWYLPKIREGYAMPESFYGGASSAQGR